MMGLGPDTLARAVAGFPVRRSTELIARIALEALPPPSLTEDVDNSGGGYMV